MAANLPLTWVLPHELISSLQAVIIGLLGWRLSTGWPQGGGGVLAYSGFPFRMIAGDDYSLFIVHSLF